MDAQDRVDRFVREHGLESPPAYRTLDLVSEVGELAKEVTMSTGYGDRPTELRIATDEIGDVLFATLALCNELDVDAGEAVDEAITKYESRIEDRDDPASMSS